MDYNKLIHKTSDIYAGFDVEKYYDSKIEDYIKARYGEVYPSFNHCLKHICSPSLLVEVGSYQGASTIFFANEFKRRGIDCKMICIDTFVGSITHWTEDYFYQDLRQENGFPTLYKQFLSVVIKNSFQDKIIPLPLTSLDGARFLKKNDIAPDMIYIDASHEYPDVLFDISVYFDCLKSGGVIFGDDYDGWPGVSRSVNEFCSNNNVKFQVINGKWFIYK